MDMGSCRTRNVSNSGVSGASRETKVHEEEEPEQGRSRRLEETLKFIRAQAGATARRSGLENCPSRWQSGHDGWFLGKMYMLPASFASAYRISDISAT